MARRVTRSPSISTPKRIRPGPVATVTWLIVAAGFPASKRNSRACSSGPGAKAHQARRRPPWLAAPLAAPLVMLWHRFAIAADRDGSGLLSSGVLAQIAAPEFG